MIPMRLYLIGGAALLAVFLILRWTGGLIESGRQQATTKIERANDAARSEADTGTQRIDRCYARGGTWNRFTRLCDEARPGQ